jgi:single-stranded-DNA-specific exonuclease
LPIQSKRWQIAPPASQQHLDRFQDLQPLVVQLLYNRNIRDPAAVREFLAVGAHGHNPFLLKGMDAAVARLRVAVRKQEPIAIYGDFDTDGVTATALLVQTLSALGSRVQPYIPHRVDEGYGLNLGSLRTLYEQGIRLVVTVDCGIRSFEEVREASKGMDLIITDHHSVAKDLPAALAIINPKQPGCAYPFEKLAGVGLAFKLAQALLMVHNKVGRQPVDLAEEDLLDLVALGTVADLAPLVGENRTLVQRGLAQLNEARRPGVQALMADAGLRRGEVDATAIGFRLGPRINAAGRIDDAMLAYRLLTSRDPLRTQALAGKLGQLNQQRQELTRRILAQAEAMVLADDPEARLYLAASEAFEPGIVGLAASRLTEAYYRPSVVVERGPKQSRGSCRSIPEFDITAALDECKELLVRHGGHAAAAGFTVETANLEALHQRLKAIAAERLAGVELRPTLKIDVEIPLEEVSWATHALLGQMEPCGIDNPQAVLASPDVAISDRRPIGDEGRHLKLSLRDRRGQAWDAVYFGGGNLLDELPGRVDLAYTLEVNEWNQRKQLQLNVQDLRPVGGERAATVEKVET